MIATRQEIAKIAQNLHDADRKIVFTNGCFDIIHRGHIEYLNKAKKLGDILIIGLNSDDSVRRLKGINRPINYEQDRAVVLDNLKSVDYVCLFDEDTPYELIKIVQPDILVKGGDWSVQDIVGSDIVLALGGEVKSLHFIEGKSTSDIIEKIKNS
ncbi:MAG: bifunctional heptose 7-phosphate kinase/heptose 1-phosphate adenyltransferase [Candidatus Cloacimonas sp. 4484_140]|nr:MAG: bifunctional heptose 7-phosphate kinase/heptose 1-phosphate adenyltransferase [Candidatus Cloacimonas sp. 4484_140]